ncbi:MAG: ethylbenzene dehydrogenase-related protein [Myxococcota bacterium]|jgi:DMSO reductase family type II enzyme heme b subunit|nr:ethylbenzene dehydrogenase-related protein [Myxococcota bacterium]
MQVDFVGDAGIDVLLDADHRVWGQHPTTSVPLLGTPVGMQPTAAIQVAWMNKKIGTVDHVDVAALHNGREIAFRLEWSAATESSDVSDNNSFPDAAAIALPVSPDAPIITMGAPGQPVNAWYWRADEPQGARQLSAEGLGTSLTFDQRVIQGRGSWKQGRWRVVLARALRVESESPVAELIPGTATGFGVAIWDGANGERGGIKAFSGNWLPLELQAASGERNA